MEPSRDIPWAEHEKVYLLAEIIKAAPVSSDTLFQYIRNAGIQPRWAEIALPQGRSLRQCQLAFQDLLAQASAGDPRSGGAGPVQYHPQPPPHQQPHQQTYSPPVELPRKRPLAPDVSTPTGRLLQPRPPNTYPADMLSGPTYIMSPTMGESTNKKRRGRPTKAEAQARAAEAAARGEPYPPPKSGKRASLASAMSTSSGEPAPGARSPGTPGPALAQRSDQMSVSMMMTTPSGENVNVAEAESRRKRGRPTSLDALMQEEGAASPTKAGAQAPEGRRDTLLPQPSPAAASTSSAGEERERDVRREPSEEYKRRATPHSFKDTVGI